MTELRGFNSVRPKTESAQRYVVEYRAANDMHAEVWKLSVWERFPGGEEEFIRHSSTHFSASSCRSFRQRHFKRAHKERYP